jgi:hypothetical protein
VTLQIVVLAVVLCVASPAFAHAASGECNTRALPAGISRLLDSEFKGFRVQTLEDLDPYDRDLWTKSKLQACPGIATGRFLSADVENFALLLVPKASTLKGYEVVVFASSGREQNSQFRPLVVEREKEQSASNLVIYGLAPGVYADPEHVHRIQLRLDGLQLEKMEVSTTIYFWQGGYFSHLVTSQ